MCSSVYMLVFVFVCKCRVEIHSKELCAIVCWLLFYYTIGYNQKILSEINIWTIFAFAVRIALAFAVND